MTDTKRLAEIGARCELATEGPWTVRVLPYTHEIDGAGGEPVVLLADDEDSGVVCKEDADFIAHAREDVPWLLELLGKADATWQATESRLVHICQLLGVDYTCEEPETCEQVIERILGRLAAIRHVVEQQTEFLRFGCDIQPSESSARAKVFISMGRRALADDAGKPEADVIAAAKRFEDADRQFMDLNRDNPWYNQCGFILLEDRAEAKKDLCEAVARMREGSSGATEALEKGGGE